MEIIKILVIEDDKKFQNRIQCFIKKASNLKIAGMVSTTKDAFRSIKRLDVDVFMIDLNLPDGSGLEVLKHINHQPHLKEKKSIILTKFGDETQIVEAIKLGANGYLLKEETDQELVRGIINVLHGVPPLSPSVAQCVLNAIKNTSFPQSSPTTLTENFSRVNAFKGAGKSAELSKWKLTEAKLSERQEQTLLFLAKGLTYKEIAQKMNITFHTVSTHAQEIYNKLAVKSRNEAVYKAQNLGLLDITHIKD